MDTLRSRGDGVRVPVVKVEALPDSSCGPEVIYLPHPNFDLFFFEQGYSRRGTPGFHDRLETYDTVGIAYFAKCSPWNNVTD